MSALLRVWKPCQRRVVGTPNTLLARRFYADKATKQPKVPKPQKAVILPEDKGDPPALLLAHKWEEDVDPTDGVRAYWDGTRFVSRLGNKFYSPDWFTKDLPADQQLDGELFGQRGDFNTTVSIVRRSDGSTSTEIDQNAPIPAGTERPKSWSSLKFQIFDIPSQQEKPFEKRVDLLNTMFPVSKGLPYVSVLQHIRCEGKNHLFTKLKEVEALKGEGLMLRQPGSKYVGDRSRTLLKVKSFSDAEALVTGFLPGKGKHDGAMGALMCELPNGKTFRLGSGFDDEERKAPPPIGSIVTFRYQELTPAGIPRFPTYVGIRIDMKWPPLPNELSQPE